MNLIEASNYAWELSNFYHIKTLWENTILDYLGEKDFYSEEEIGKVVREFFSDF